MRISNKGLQLQVLPMYGGLPYSDQVFYVNSTFPTFVIIFSFPRLYIIYSFTFFSQLQVFHRTAPNTRKVE